jgi:hypothetical protein
VRVGGRDAALRAEPEIGRGIVTRDNASSVASGLLCLLALTVSPAAVAQETAPFQDPLANSAVLPVGFEPNVGQGAGQAAFFARTGGNQLRLLRDQLEIQPSDPGASPLALRFIGASPDVVLVGEDRLPGLVHYRIGAPDGWLTDIPTYASVRYVGLYPGVDLVLAGDGGRLEIEFAVAAGADPDHISFQLDDGLRLEPAASGTERHGGDFRALAGGRFACSLTPSDTETLSVAAALSLAKPASAPGLDAGLRVATDPGHVYLAGSVRSLRAGSTPPTSVGWTTIAPWLSLSTGAAAFTSPAVRLRETSLLSTPPSVDLPTPSS